ncbi:bifunctional [glutamine synthetase] adenylyltransferase/[glutamine synthetase]-adenylyl-L-tyrosine phosphorylase [Candidatus Puniceispirillum sp.]|jgi:[glutamine synthetase] adenylyltransferase / [glutamine synthetase]-adenylyl-L-tyrosine phosphorylase|uniref:bifunctional [glutamine synthetase] adenylyltransferase/[glutamine synthetase]-adenylyl-L-tyrosine phosphorylase n=1 Tax=Candidatus Puniceispirillum sp. TaxID=2026719 RepID=UPI001EC9B80E|nr:bifunctional [glutamine synthetase] adenylyltransferase/[glutamine synthetase]-adenylyl-L-tyrosine phosphorylase [Candidatus Puniceispirillum sp.]
MVTTQRHFDRICPSIPYANPDKGELASALVAEFAPYLDANNANTDDSFSPTDIATIFTHAPHLLFLARRFADDIARILAGNAADIINEAHDKFRQSMRHIDDENKAMQTIRHFRGRVSFAAALADIAGLTIMETQFTWLSDAATCAVQETAHFLMRHAARRGLAKPPQDNLSGCGWIIFAVGKLGAEELNYSSDIDLIIIHDPDANPLNDPATAQAFYVAQTRALVKLLSAATADGIGWRIDLRLRPDPGATAVSIQIAAALGYYESIARTWERAAFIRARPIAGDIEAGYAFLDEIQPFIWRRSFDYTVMDDMRTMLRRPPDSSQWTEFNLKTGHGGIRTIEFFTHVLQLVFGGREPEIRQHRTPQALHMLAKKDWITSAQANGLIALYTLLRRAEHRLQMIADQQTHSLPRDDVSLINFARFMGHESAQSLCDTLADILSKVSDMTAHDLLDGILAANISDTSNLVKEDNKTIDIFLEDQEQLVTWLNSIGFERPTDVATALSGWIAGRIPATRGERSRMLLGRLMPELLRQLAKGTQPDNAFAALAYFIEELPASVQIFSLLDYNRHLARLLCDIIVLSPRLTQILKRNPMLFELLLYKEFFDPLPNAQTIAGDIRKIITGQPVEDALDNIKRHTRELRFRAELQAISLSSDRATLERSLSAIADATTQTVLELARADMERRHGKIAGMCGIIALGRLGIAQLTATSDLDILFVYDAPDAARSDGTRSLDATSYYIRLTQTFVSWLTTQSAEGALYEVDLRLRPEGSAGAVATPLDRLAHYIDTDIWLWEKLALTKARFVAGDDNLSDMAMKPIHDAINQAHNRDDVMASITDMRKRMAASQTATSKWQLRLQTGGLGDLDLLIQGLRLIHGDHFVKSGQTVAEILALLTTDKLIDSNDANILADAHMVMGNAQHALRLSMESTRTINDALPPALGQFLSSWLDMADVNQVAVALDDIRASVREIMTRL